MTFKNRWIPLGKMISIGKSTLGPAKPSLFCCIFPFTTFRLRFLSLSVTKIRFRFFFVCSLWGFLLLRICFIVVVCWQSKLTRIHFLALYCFVFLSLAFVNNKMNESHNGLFINNISKFGHNSKPPLPCHTMTLNRWPTLLI